MRMRIPGTFVCLQGMPGDGRSNTIDTFPNIDDRQSDFDDDIARVDEWKASSRVRECLQRQDWLESSRSLHHYSNNDDNHNISIISNPLTALYNFTKNNNTLARSQDNPWWLAPDGSLALFRTLPYSNGATHVSSCGSLHAGATVVATELVTLSSHNPTKQLNVAPISGLLSSTEGASPTTTTTNASFSTNIYPQGRVGQIQVLKLLSLPSNDASDDRSICSSEKDSLVDSKYVVASVDGYCFLAPGLPAHYCTPQSWWWVVSCVEGAYVRAGPELTSRHLHTLPYGSFVRVQRQTVNTMGLSRIQVQALLEQGDDNNNNNNNSDVGNQQLVVEGWCSEFLNPLSGQRGTVLHPLPLPVPALYKVSNNSNSSDGYLNIRSGIELSSPIIGQAPVGAILPIVSRAYSNSSFDSVTRYRLAGDGGWISVLESHTESGISVDSPMTVVAEFVETDPSFDPDNPGLYHIEALRRVSAQQHHDTPMITPELLRNRHDIQAISVVSSSLMDDEEIRSGLSDDSMLSVSHMFINNLLDRNNSTPTKVQADVTSTMNITPSCSYSSTSSSPRQRRSPLDEPSGCVDHYNCLICLCEERSATIVHGETGHVACCLVCARILKARNDPCPVCRLPIDSVIQHFYA